MLIDELAEFACASEYTTLPPAVVEESKRIVLDSLGCAVGATDSPKGRIGIEYGRLLGGCADDDATIIGTGERANIFGAAFANGELINALDFDAVLPPGHVVPYVLPGALAVAESRHSSGRDLIAAVAVAHEMSYRIGKAMDYLRDVKGGKVTPPPVYGYSSTVFGATAAIAMLMRLSADVQAHALGIAGCIAPANAFHAWDMHAPATTIKYLMAGPLIQAALTAAHTAELGHRGARQILDDREYGFPRYMGTSRWEPEKITDALGEQWRFPAEQTFKPYPHCRILHALLDGLTAIVDEHDVKPDEIEAINAWGEGWVQLPNWMNRAIDSPVDAQFSIAHGLAVGAHRLTPGPEWQRPDVVSSPSVLDLMERVNYHPHPDYDQSISARPASRPSRVEVVARGTTYSTERSYPKGTPSPDPSTRMTDDELVAKFRVNADGRLSASAIGSVVEAVLNLDRVDDVAKLMRLVAIT
jgi:2-methylcitrate dehydratase PrpD